MYMRLLTTLALLFISSLTYGQGIWNQVNGNSKFWRLKADSVLIVPRDTTPTNNALYLGAPVGNYGRLAVKNGILYYHNDTLFKPVGGGGNIATKPKIITNVSGLSTLNNSDSLVFVLDTLRGGYFIWSSIGVVDGGTVFAGSTGYWIRQYDTKGGLNVCWYGAKGDGVTDDTDAIKAALLAVKAGGAIYFPNRNRYPPGGITFYKVSSSITISKTGVKLYGDAELKGYSTTIQATSGTFPIFIVTDAEVSFWGLSIRGNGTYSIIHPASGAGRWAEGATVSGIRVDGDAVSNGDIKINNCAFLYLDTAIILKARNADISNNLFTQIDQAVVILDATVGQQRGFKIQNNWIHSAGDTTVGKAVFKSVDPNAFQIWITNNQIDGQTNAMLADIAADSAVQIIGNNNTLGRGGMIRLTGVNGAVVGDNYFLGGSYQTRGHGVELSGTRNVNVTGNVIQKAANDGITLVNADLTTVSDNKVGDFSWPNKANTGTYSGINIDVASENNSIYSNVIAITSASQPYNKMINHALLTTNHISMNDQYKGVPFVPEKGVEFITPPKTRSIMFAPEDSIRKWDITYFDIDTTLRIAKTGKLNAMWFHPSGRVSIGGDSIVEFGAVYSKVQLFGSVGYSTALVSSNTALTDLHNVISVSTPANVVISLPPASDCLGRIYSLKKVSNNSNTITVDPNAAETIDGATTYIFSQYLASIEFISNGTGWLILSTVRPDAHYSNVRTLTGSATIDATYQTVLVNNVGAATITLPAASTVTGIIYELKKMSAASNDVIIDPNAAETIDGTATKTLTLQYSSIKIRSTGTTWVIVASHAASTVL